MNGKEVFKIAVRSMEEISRQALAEAGVEINQLSLVIPHQANRTDHRRARRTARCADGKVMVNVDKYGNTSAASIPVRWTKPNAKAGSSPAISCCSMLSAPVLLGRGGGEVLTGAVLNATSVSSEFFRATSSRNAL